MCQRRGVAAAAAHNARAVGVLSGARRRRTAPSAFFCLASSIRQANGKKPWRLLPAGCTSLASDSIASRQAAACTPRYVAIYACDVAGASAVPAGRRTAAFFLRRHGRRRRSCCAGCSWRITCRPRAGKSWRATIFRKEEWRRRRAGVGGGVMKTEKSERRAARGEINRRRPGLARKIERSSNSGAK